MPKMSLSMEKVVEQNPRILDLREKLNEISKKQECKVDKKTKGLINDLTQQLVDKNDEEESGPYSLLFDLQSDPSTSFKEKTEVNVWNRPNFEGSCQKTQSLKKSIVSVKNVDKLPNILNFDDKTMKEFEYSCENEFNFPVKQIFNTHSRSDLCLHLKSHLHPKNFEVNLSPNDNSLNKTNEENSLDDSLGILTPDQMDDICYLENAFSPTVEGLPIFGDTNHLKNSPDNGDTPSTDKTESSSAASTIQNEQFENIDNNQQSRNQNITLSGYYGPVTKLESIINIEKQSTIDQESLADNIITISCAEEIGSRHLRSLNLPLKGNFLENEEFVSNLVDEEFMPSIHSSILEPVSSIADNVHNLEIPLDCKQENILISNRIEQTPSPEDLPLDNSDINGEISTYSQFSASTVHDSQTYSDGKNEYPKSMETSKVSNSFITSITSITSLDGYQGDGEMSRPVSRGADHSMENREDVIEMDWQNVPVTRRADPMTDSDFFTESDADGLDDHMQRGDRRAQVIDGALYGGKNGNLNPPLIVNRNEDSCMESSGVYTDFENHRTSPVFLNVIVDMSPEGSTPSTRSECSQKNVSTSSINVYFSPLQDNLIDKKLDCKPHSADKDETPKNTSKRNSLHNDKAVKTDEKAKEEKKNFTLKKYKMPKRDVPSKLKIMLSSRKSEIDNSVQNSPKAIKKTDRRENLSKNNSLDTKPDFNKMKSFKDIKSKVDSSFTLQRSQTSCSVTRILTSKSTNANVKPKGYVY